MQKRILVHSSLYNPLEMDFETTCDMSFDGDLLIFQMNEV